MDKQMDRQIAGQKYKNRWINEKIDRWIAYFRWEGELFGRLALMKIIKIILQFILNKIIIITMMIKF